MILKVAQLGHPVLRKKAEPVPLEKISSPRIQGLIQDMLETMEEYDGIGIAAPQVHVSLQLALIGSQGSPRYPKAPKVPFTVLINPKIKPVSSHKEVDWEGCLSVEGLRGQVPRWRSVEVEGYNAKGEWFRFRADGFHARVVQHEWDHLQGHVYLDRMPDLTTLCYMKEFARYWADD
ncbi:MAG: peptide deformylase [Candidatus Omnitrophica bacterium]|nr:peptide deformylase [Candidatus Omnitrophota bacterium]